MGITIGPVDWWLETPDSLDSLIASCPVGTVLPDKSAIICKAGGTAWIVAPATTQVSATWNGSTTTQVGDKCCVCDWPTLCSQLISCGFNPSDWFVPSVSQLQNPGWVCCSKWDNASPAVYWSSTETNSTCAEPINYVGGGSYGKIKTNGYCVRAFRCVTY